MALVCVDCQAESDDDARGWKAYLDCDEAGDGEIVIFCPVCVSREIRSIDE